jgi:hypothetical protein
VKYSVSSAPQLSRRGAHLSSSSTSSSTFLTPDNSRKRRRASQRGSDSRTWPGRRPSPHRTHLLRIQTTITTPLTASTTTRSPGLGLGLPFNPEAAVYLAPHVSFGLLPCHVTFPDHKRPLPIAIIALPYRQFPLPLLITSPPRPAIS